MSVRAKFRVEQKIENMSHDPDAVNFTVKLAAVTANNKDNESWSAYTPSGDLTMCITNPAALPMFEVGKEYYLDIKPVE